MKKILLLSLILFLCNHQGRCFVQPNDSYNFTNLSIKEGLSQISVMKILQDSDGYMWFGTRNGLNKYDGNKFTVYKHNFADSLSLTDSHITELIEDNDGNLWVGTVIGLNKLNLRTNKNTPYYREKCNLFRKGIRSLFIDSRNRLWVGTSKGLCLYIKELDLFQIVDLNGLIKDEFIPVIRETHDNRLIIGTVSKGFFVCDMNLKVIKHYSKNLVDESLSSNGIADIYEDSRKQLWVGYAFSGLAKIDLDTDEVTKFTNRNSNFTSNNIRCITESGDVLYIGTFDGVYALNVNTNEMIRHSNVELKQGNLSHYSIYSLCVDNAGTVWIGSYAGGVNYFSKYNNRFRFHDPQSIFNNIFGVFGSMVCKSDYLYMATEGGGLLEYDLKNKEYRHYLIEQSQYNNNILKTVMLEGDIIWCGTSKNQIYQFNTKTKKFTHYYSFPRTVSIYSICRASDGSLWIGTSDRNTGLLKINKNRKVQSTFETVNIQGNSMKQSSVRCIMELRKGVFLIGTRNNGLIKYDENSKLLERYNEEQPGSNHLYSNYITCILKDSSKRIWIGTFGGGFVLYDEEKGILKHITSADGLIEDEVCAIVEDKKQQLWISTTNGISLYNPKDKEFSIYEQFSGIGVQEFSPHSGALLPNGNICFSGNNGFVTFNPNDLRPNSFKPPIVFTGLTINNKEIIPGDQSGILKNVINTTQKIELAYNQSNISISYSALNYIFPDKNQYAYKLIGHDNTWNFVGHRREAYYTNLSPGNYVFEIKASNNDGIWNDQSRTLHITIFPPIWKTWYAYLVYIILLISIFSLILYYINSKLRLERELKYKQLEKQQMEEFHQTKIRLFTNFSHELRTPLTLIIAPLQELLKMSDFNLTIKNKLSLISSNAQRLLLLVNQLMDLRKNQAGKMQLKISRDDIYSFIEEIYYAFNQIAESKHINFHFEKDEERSEAWFDKSLFEKVIFNMLSNAFKYTKQDGKIILSIGHIDPTGLSHEQLEALGSIHTGVKYILLSVSNTGKNIPESEIKNIFTPFYQIEKHDESNVVGTGIGLSLTQSIVQLHHGIIWVEPNQPDGAVFKVVIPVSQSIYNDDQFADDKNSTGITDILPSTSPQEVIAIEKKHTILLVEDNDDVRKYVEECLAPYFYVLTADNGVDALDIAIDKYPDLIISDIMMPKMDGIQLCTQIKNDLRIGHIPVVLMTAKSMVMHIKEGFSVGADDYIIKPFNIDVLIYRVRNLLDSREKLKRLYGKKFSPDSLGIEIVSADDRFTQKFFAIIEENIANSELNIDLLCREIGLSRANLYRKLKAITELSPIELIRNKRLEVAAKLLCDSDMSISEIFVHVGFNSHTHFTNSFKMVYGYSPSEFIKRYKGGEAPLLNEEH